MRLVLPIAKRNILSFERSVLNLEHTLPVADFQGEMGGHVQEKMRRRALR
jgi:hypothetical protein